MMDELYVKRKLNLDLDNDAMVAEMHRHSDKAAALNALVMTKEAEYRHWRATKGQEILAADPKLAEWKVSQQIESDGEFIDRKQDIANIIERRDRHAALAQAYKTALDLRSSISKL